MNPRLKVDLDADTSKLDAKVKQTSDKVKKAVNQKGGPNVSAAGEGTSLASVLAPKALGVTALVATTGLFIKKTMDYADALDDLSSQTNIATEDLDALSKSAHDSGKDLPDALKMIEEIQNSRIEALNGDENKMAAFNRLGISKDELANTKNVMQLLAGVNSAGADNGNALRDIVGKKSLGTFRAMQDDLKDWEEFKGRLKEQGRLIDPENIRNVAEFNDTLRELKETLQTSALPIISSILRTLIDSFNWFIDEFEVFSSGAFAALGAMDSFWQVFRNMLMYPFEHPKEFFENAWKGIFMLPDIIAASVPKEMTDAFDEAIAQAQKDVDDRREERERKRNLANQDKEVAGASQPLIPKTKADTEKPQEFGFARSSDAFNSVGNFLGMNTGMNAVTQRTNSLLTEQLEVQKQMLETLKFQKNVHRDFTLG